MKIWPSKAKNLEKFDFDVQTGLAPPKSAENDESLISEADFCIPKKKNGVEKSKAASLLKRVLPKFRADRRIRS